MPHIILEFAEQALSTEQIPTILNAIHMAVLESGLFEASHIKTRAYPMPYYTNAGGDEPYIHVTARIKSGRNSEQKKSLSQVIVSALSGLSLQVQVITVEVVDMDRSSYSKLQNR